MLSIPLSHWISFGSCCKTDIMWAKLFLPSRLYVQSISLKIKKCPGFKCQSSIIVSLSVKILFFWLWKSIWRAFSTKTIASSTIWLSVCSKPIAKKSFSICIYKICYEIEYLIKTNFLVKRFVHLLPLTFSSFANNFFMFAVDENKSCPSFPLTTMIDVSTCVHMR